MENSIEEVIEAAAERNAQGFIGSAPASDSLLDLLSRLLDDHKRVEPHNVAHCDLCQSTTQAIVIAAEQHWDEVA